jgi:MFS family permease
VAAFLVTGALLSSPFGSLSDRIGRKKLIQAGLLADVFLSTLTGLIQNWQSLLIVRALNGVATAAVRRTRYFVDSTLSVIAIGLVAWKAQETRGCKKFIDFLHF